jgi:hypothetical protein
VAGVFPSKATHRFWKMLGALELRGCPCGIRVPRRAGDCHISSVPLSLVRVMNQGPLNPAGKYVVYWMISARRLRWNFGLQRAVDYAVSFRKPLVILEAFATTRARATGCISSCREHDGQSAARCAKSRALLIPTSSRRADTDARSCPPSRRRRRHRLVPGVLPAADIKAAGARLTVLLEAVDSNGIVPIAAPPRSPPRASIGNVCFVTCAGAMQSLMDRYALDGRDVVIKREPETEDDTLRRSLRPSSLTRVSGSSACGASATSSAPRRCHLVSWISHLQRHALCWRQPADPGGCHGWNKESDGFAR